MQGISIIVTSLDRRVEVERLVKQIMDCEIHKPFEIICVNASFILYKFDFTDKTNFREIKSNKKNQPYQRLLGAELAKYDYLIFFDDDLQIIDNKIFGYLIAPFSKDNNVVSTGIREVFEGEEINYITDGRKEENSKSFISKFLYIFKKWQPGDSWLIGCEPYQVHKADYVESFHSGNVPCVRKDVFLKSYDRRFLLLFDKKKGKGEDKVFSLRANKFGKLRIVNKACVMHPRENASFYSVDYITWRMEILKSRFYCADAYSFGFRKNLILCRLYMIWYSLFSIINYASNEKEFIRRIKLMSLQLPAMIYSIYYTWIFPVIMIGKQKQIEIELLNNIKENE
jgi:glycosyltransferase involved in cell wall biosynthesis